MKNKIENKIPTHLNFKKIERQTNIVSKHTNCPIYKTHLYKVFPLYKPIVRLV